MLAVRSPGACSAKVSPLQSVGDPKHRSNAPRRKSGLPTAGRSAVLRRIFPASVMCSGYSRSQTGNSAAWIFSLITPAFAVLRQTAELSPEQWERTLATNLSGVFYCCREAIARFRQRGEGFIINIGSLLGKTAVAGGAAYCASKFGLNGLGEAMLLDCRDENIGVCTILPGSVDTELFGSRVGTDWKMHPEDVAQMVIAILEMPQRTLVSRVEMRPLRPPQ